MAKYEHVVTTEESGLTINQILRMNYKFSARFRTKMKYQQLVDLNGTPTPGYVKPGVGDVIGVRLPEEKSDFEPEDIPLDIIYEDDDLILVNKQPGVIVHPTKGHPQHTIANAVMKYMIDSGQSFKIRFANRIDMDTTGIIIVAKNANAQNDLSSQMRRNTVVKKYYALTEGDIEENHFEIERYESKKYGQFTLVEVILHTGRTHQIRVHLSHIGHIITGDSLYGGSTELMQRQALHAYYIEFDHPVTKERVSFRTGLPDDMRDAINKLKNSAE